MAISTAWRGPRIGLGCMTLTGIYDRIVPATAIQTIRRALDLGVDHFDTADLYGPSANEDLLAEALGADTRQVTIATKFGYRLEDGKIIGLESRPERIRDAVEGSLRRLKREAIDLLYQHRPDPKVPVEDVVGTMADQVAVGKVRSLGLSATDLATLRRAEAIHSIAAVQNEFSYLERAAEGSLLEAVAASGAVFVAFSPLTRGRLAGGAIAADARAGDDYRRGDARFANASLDATNLEAQGLFEIAHDRGVAPASIALALLLARHSVLRVIPGARTPAQVDAAWAALHLTLAPDELAHLAPGKAKGQEDLSPEPKRH